MKRLFFLLMLFTSLLVRAQNKPFSSEDFVNAISPLVLDSNLDHYYLSINAAPCSFRQFDYDEWYKYGLEEAVPFYILNELAKQVFTDPAPHHWKQENLDRARCIDEETAKSFLSPVLNRHTKLNDQSPDNKMVFYFSYPAFTQDYQYAVMDMAFRCDDRQCGMGTTIVFRQVNGKWHIAGKKMVWVN